MEAYQHKIAEMALAVCQIRHGGPSDKYYTLSDFADDIKVNRKTLSNWVAVYRDVLLKCDIKKPTPDQWKTASKVEKTLKTQRTVDNAKSGTPRSLKPYRKDIPKEQIKTLFNEIESNISDPYLIDRIFSSVRYNKGKLEGIDLSKCDEKKLIHIMMMLDQASDYINDYLTTKEESA